MGAVNFLTWFSEAYNCRYLLFANLVFFHDLGHGIASSEMADNNSNGHPRTFYDRLTKFDIVVNNNIGKQFSHN